MKLHSNNISWIENRDEHTVAVQLKDNGKTMFFPQNQFNKSLPDEPGEFEAPTPIKQLVIACHDNLDKTRPELVQEIKDTYPGWIATLVKIEGDIPTTKELGALRDADTVITLSKKLQKGMDDQKEIERQFTTKLDSHPRRKRGKRFHGLDEPY